jgi:hypothetical protein
LEGGLIPQKKEALAGLPFMLKWLFCLVARADGFYRAHFGACAAVGTRVGIDHIDRIAFADRFHRAFGEAGATSSTVITDYISHGILLAFQNQTEIM